MSKRPDRLPFGLFPAWGAYQDFRCWRDVVAIPAVRHWLWVRRDRIACKLRYWRYHSTLVQRELNRLTHEVDDLREPLAEHLGRD